MISTKESFYSSSYDDIGQILNFLPLHHYICEDKSDNDLYCYCNPNFILDFSNGCIHRCVYCYVRSKLSNGFFQRVIIKDNILNRLEHDLVLLKQEKLNWPILISGNSDPYQSISDLDEIRKKAIEIINNYKNHIIICTKSPNIQKDFKLFNQKKVIIEMSINTYDDKISKEFEPNVAPASKRLNTLREAIQMGFSVIPRVNPIIPMVTDGENLRNLLLKMSEIGVKKVTIEFLEIPKAQYNFFDFMMKRNNRAGALFKDLYNLYYNNAYFPSPNYIIETLAFIIKWAKEYNVQVSFCRDTFLKQKTCSILQDISKFKERIFDFFNRLDKNFVTT